MSAGRNAGGGRCPFASRRGFLAAAGGLAGALGAGLGGGAAAQVAPGAVPAPMLPAPLVEPFWGKRQAGILTAPQGHTYFAAFDLVTDKPGDVVALLRAWTAASARMTAGLTAGPMGTDLTVAPADSGEAMGLAASRLTLTFGFGASLFTKDGRDRLGLAALRPEALVEMPRFNGDQLVEARSDGDLSVQACAEDPMVAFHAVRQLVRLAAGVAQVRWAQTGFNADAIAGQTPRNLMGFKDGTETPMELRSVSGGRPVRAPNPEADAVIWVGDEGPAWLRGGSYMVVRRIRMALEHWDRTDTEFQEQVIGRHKHSGAPLGQVDEFEVPDLEAVDADGNLRIPDDSHLRLATPVSNGGAQMLRRGYSYNDGANFTAERWPPWRQGVELDAGLLFIAYQRDPRTSFIRVNENLSKLDALNQFTTHTASGLFACPAGLREGEFIGQGLFPTA